MAAYPCVPRYVHGFVIEKEGQRWILWSGDGVEPEQPSQANESTAQELRDLLGTNPRPIIMERDGRLHCAFEDRGFRLIAERRYSFMSGTLYQEADFLAEQAEASGRQREEIRAANQGREPGTVEESLTWYRVNYAANAYSHAAELVAASAIEAFLNEVLQNSFPEAYERLEFSGRPKPPRVKLDWLLDELKIPKDSPWMRDLSDGFDRRRITTHFRPGFVDDGDLVAGPLEAGFRPAEARAFVNAVIAAMAAVFAAMDSPFPPTHLPWMAACEVSMNVFPPRPPCAGSETDAPSQESQSGS